MQRTKGFTLVEILIVVIILGILAAIVIPQFTEASNDARKSQLVSDLQTVRSQVELYKVQHLERLPSVNESAAADPTNFVNRMTKKTDHTGKLDDNGLFGPYLQKFPTNPFASTEQDGVTFGAVDPAPGNDATGWYFNTSTGKFSANDSTINAAK
ncbi:MAG TPA: prepilin-type N-terminal cleavage/methylation domain-containing protein [Phycisphaerae bacterium]|nr:prepilin-type N-terminal cleavage/methylation domain-containing protein [Phycisphaerae bacterium]